MCTRPTSSGILGDGMRKKKLKPEVTTNSVAMATYQNWASGAHFWYLLANWAAWRKFKFINKQIYDANIKN